MSKHLQNLFSDRNGLLLGGKREKWHVSGFGLHRSYQIWGTSPSRTQKMMQDMTSHLKRDLIRKNIPSNNGHALCCAL